MTERTVEQFSCLKCGGPVVLRAPDASEAVVCTQCKAILDVSDENVRLLQEFEGAITKKPLIPLGTRGKIFDGEFEVIGFMVRKITVDYESYRWSEYLLYNPLQGYRWLTEYEGHWNKVEVLASPPLKGHWMGRSNNMTVDEITYKHFQQSSPEVECVLGEFYWKVKVGDKAELNDFVSPPHMMSVEKTPSEVSWSRGTYVDPGEIWSAFGLDGFPPFRKGVFANQPNPHAAASKGAGKTFGILAALAIGVYALLSFHAKEERVLHQEFTYNQDEAEPSRVSDPFVLRGRPTNVRVRSWANVDNDYIYLHMTLVNQDTDQAMDFGREISYYHGRDVDGNWSEGKQNDTVFLPHVPPGNYYLRVEPEKDVRQNRLTWAFNYRIDVDRDVPRISYLFYALLLLLIPFGLFKYLHFAFERDRWNESDHPYQTEGAVNPADVLKAVLVIAGLILALWLDA